MSKKVMVAMSGGVDSSVAAVLLKEQGYEVCGATLKLFGNDDIGITDRTRTCCSLADVQDARSVAYRMGIDHFVFNFGDHFQKDVISRFVQGYVDGRTPNPCIDCNRYIKFSKLLTRAQLMEQDYIATGHYARVEWDEQAGRYLLKKARDIFKDQSYVLYSMTQDELARTLFPLGNLLKTEVRTIAEDRGLVNSKKPDSQDICFVKDGDYAGFLENVMGVKSESGDMVDSEGNKVGCHRGIIHYTIGQRKGLGMSFESPRYVIKKDRVTNTITIGNQTELFSDSLTAEDVNWISIEKLEMPMQVTVKTRYKQPETPAVIYPLANGRVYVTFKEAQRAITPGQAVVFYNGDIVVGGGTIIS